MDTQEKGSGEQKIEGFATFDYLKSQFYRVIFASGVYGGPTPDANYVHMSIFNERLPIPLKETYSVTPAGQLTGLQRKESRDCTIVRELEVGIIFDVKTAVIVRDWIDQQIAKIEAVRKAVAAKE